MLPGRSRAHLATGGSFTFDQIAPTQFAGFFVEATTGNVTVANPITLNGSNTLTLRADAGAVAINANGRT